MQAHVNVASKSEEFVLETLVSFDKITTLVHELVAIELWRRKIYPILVQHNFAKNSTMTPYIVLYHEATIINLLEAVMYHKEACEAAGDTILDLSDYCCRAINFLITIDPSAVDIFESMTTMQTLQLEGQEHLEHQIRGMDRNIAIKAVSIIRYITDHITRLPLAAITRLLNTHDLPCMLVSLLEKAPWKRRFDGRDQLYQEGKWVDVVADQRFKLSLPEAQVWLALYNVIMEPECRRKYVYNTHNKNEILKLRSHFNELIVDQIPVLGELRRSLEELSLMAPSDVPASIVLEQLPEIWSGLMKINRDQWAAIAKFQMANVFVDDANITKQQAISLAATYNLDALESLFPEDPKCVVCGNPATKRCSRCQTEWYCRRQCQVEHWPKHKEMCNMVSAASKTSSPQ